MLYGIGNIYVDDSLFSCLDNIALYGQQCNPDSSAQNHFNYTAIVRLQKKDGVGKK